MAGSDEDRGRSRRPGGRVIEKSGDVMCGLHRACGDVERGFLDSPSKQKHV
jgi:hypothetical protein